MSLRKILRGQSNPRCEGQPLGEEDLWQHRNRQQTARRGAGRIVQTACSCHYGSQEITYNVSSRLAEEQKRGYRYICNPLILLEPAGGIEPSSKLITNPMGNQDN